MTSMPALSSSDFGWDVEERRNRTCQPSHTMLRIFLEWLRPLIRFRKERAERCAQAGAQGAKMLEVRLDSVNNMNIINWLWLASVGAR
jgi:hypothetical protein